jgi:hypothetical protein
MNRSQLNLAKVLLSIFILFQISAVFILPNPEGILYRELAPVVVNYGNLFGFNTTWRFFSPNPMVRVLEYDLYTRDAAGSLQSETFRHPRLLKEERFREVYNRKLNNGMYMMGQPEKLKLIMGPWLCRQHPQAETISVYARGLVLPTMEKSQLMGAMSGSFDRQQLGEVQRQQIIDIECNTPEETP